MKSYLIVGGIALAAIVAIATLLTLFKPGVPSHDTDKVNMLQTMNNERHIYGAPPLKYNTVIEAYLQSIFLDHTFGELKTYADMDNYLQNVQYKDTGKIQAYLKEHGYNAQVYGELWSLRGVNGSTWITERTSYIEIIKYPRFTDMAFVMGTIQGLPVELVAFASEK